MQDSIKSPSFRLRRYQTAALFLALLCGLSACSSKDYPPLETVDYVEPDKFAGKWFIIANIPYFAEKNKVGSYTIYRKREGRIYDDIYGAHEKDFSKPEKQLKGRVKIVNESNTRWKSTFYRVINFTFEVVHIEGDYEIVLLGHPSRDYGWVMARTNTINSSEDKNAMTVFKDRGYDTAKFFKVPQLPEQIGQLGFQ